MRSKSLISVIFIMIIQQLSAQILYPTQPKNGYYEELKKIISVVPDEAKLINVKASPIPVSFKDTLLNYDWYEISSYFVFDKSYSTDFGKDLTEREEKYANNEFRFKRYTPAGIIYDMKLDRTKAGVIKVYTTTFDESKAGKLIEVKKAGTKNMMVTSIYGETEMQEIVSFIDGILIMKIRQSPNTTTKMFINAYKAVPKTF